MVYCSQCGTKNTAADKFCTKCGSTLIKQDYFNIKTYNDFNGLLSTRNKNIVGKLSFSIDAYNTILKNIRDQGKANYDELLEETPANQRESMDILSKIALITLAFTKINYKSRGAELGSYSFNLINIDDRLDNANQISTLIHELSHHLVSEIFEQALMYMLEARKSEALEAFAWLSLATPVNALMNEYCAHTVEGRFIPHGYQNYGSFNNLLMEHFDPKKEEDIEMVHSQLVFGNSIAEDVIDILEYFITPELREEIKEQYKKDYNFPPKYDQIMFETKDVLPPQVKVSLINIVLDLGFDIARDNLHDETFNEILNDFKKNFTIVNKGL